jgi:formylglycine-generating enzyme required for sulfatase activity
MGTKPALNRASGGGLINRILRGGTYTGRASIIRSANRGWHDAGNRDADVGLRLVRTLSPDR